MRARALLLALGILVFALVLMLIISSKASAKEVNDQTPQTIASLPTAITLDEVQDKLQSQIVTQLKPDIAITEVKITEELKENEVVVINIKLENLGTGSANNIVTSFYVDSECVDSKETSFIKGAQRSSNLNKVVSSESNIMFYWQAKYGEHLLSFYADSNDAIEELDETNNYYTVRVNVVSANEHSVSDIAPTTSNIVNSAAGIACAVSLLALLAFALDKYKFYTMISPLYVKLKREKLLDQFTRGRIYQYLHSHPGAHYSMIKTALGLNNSTLAYHLATLEREEYIKSRREGHLRCFYLADVNLERKNGLSKLQNTILELVTSHQGITQKQLLELLGNLTQQSLSYNVKILTALNALKMVRRGKETYLFSTTYATN
ncbi:MAG: CARDB domain-containing protein [Candidatus Thermoplasmatota archaeon]|nr:CARDB domain-containing protein [Candidatus Thermoplasmatota archaeon]